MKYRSYAIWVISAFLIALAIAFAHWHFTDMNASRSFSNLLVTYGLYSASLGTLLGLRMVYIYFDQGLYEQAVSIKFFFLVWAVSVLLLFASYVPYL
ncbi:hypothetical protein LRP49_00325 [Enterovibrio sp. ZSDZ35]|uniref:Uncharacterized protein n=1 Tax=Enterovibrio qingdaonensis TaxID=2899818 RepID=A0ABT5QGL1_9GAMM|nr:hypothetical protein [Enterovibrio sp. ZSDZ35]MDD1779625.1 hypothetical protein [Enterovibrio sp. ZSDZ35]